MRGARSLARLALVTGIASGGAPPEAARAQAVACNPSTNVPSYSYREIVDAADVPSFYPVVPRLADNGEVAVLVPLGNEAGLNAPRCLVRHSGLVARTLLCTKSVDPTSALTLLEPPIDINSRGAITLTGGPGSRRVLIVPRSGPYTLVVESFEGFPREINDVGNVAYVSPPSWNLFGALAGGGVTGVAAAGSFDDGFFSSASGDVLYFAGNTRVGRIRNAFSGTASVEAENAPGTVSQIDRTGGFAHASFAANAIFRRVSVGGSDTLVVDFDDPAAPLISFPSFAKLGCSVALLGTARGVCRGGTRDRGFCDPFPPGGGNECAATGGFCESGVRGLFRWQGGPIVPLLLAGDPLLGSTVESFVTDTLIAPLHIEGNLASQILFSVKLANGRDLLVRGDPAGASKSVPFVPSACIGGSCSVPLDPSGYDGVGPDGVPIYLTGGLVPSPGGGSAGDALAGFDYAVESGDPRFASVQIPSPLPTGDEEFVLQLQVGAQSFPLAADEQFDLTTVDPAGVAGFAIRGFDTGASIDPAEVVSGVTFVAEAPVELTITAVVPEPGAAAASAAALFALTALARRRRPPGGGASGRPRGALGVGQQARPPCAGPYAGDEPDCGLAGAPAMNACQRRAAS